jgi:uncharacterized membrane protein YphA (DoxX/SURF4 family)
MEQLYPWMHLVGRVLLSMIFISSGAMHFVQRNSMVAYAAGKGAPLPKLTVPLAGAMIVVGGLFVALGWHRFIGAGLVFIFTVLAAFFMHAFWKEKDPMARMNEQVHFMKDLGLGGGALFMAYYAGHPWPMSIGG